MCETNANLIYPNANNIERKTFSFENHNSTNKVILFGFKIFLQEIIRKNTVNHIIAANYIKMAQEEAMQVSQIPCPNFAQNIQISNNIFNSSNSVKSNEMTAFKRQQSAFAKGKFFLNPKKIQKIQRKVRNLMINTLTMKRER